jgi:hypothetical protein
MRQGVRFDGPDEVEGDPALTWTWEQTRDGDLALAVCDFIDEPHSPYEDGRAMRMLARAAGDAPATLWQRARAFNRRFSTSLAATKIELDILPEQLPRGSSVILHLDSSFHPASDGRPAGRYGLQYRIGRFESVRRHTERDGLLGVIEQPAYEGRWQRLSFCPVDDIAALWPDLVAADNGLNEMAVGLTVGSAEAGDVSAVVDRLRFHRSNRDGGDGLRLRRSVLDSYQPRYKDIRQYEALEISLTRHINWFGGKLTFPDYGNIVIRDDDVDLATTMVDFIHENGGLSSWNHPMGSIYKTATPASVAEITVRTNALGADIVEIGHQRQLDDLLGVFDIAARNAVVFTATGVTDDHYAEDWVNQSVNYLTSVWSASEDLPDLLNSLRLGRAWFAAAGAWRGTLDIEADGMAAMGRVLSSASDKAAVRISLTDLPNESTVEIITGPVDRPGVADLRAVTSSMLVPAAGLKHNCHEFDLKRPAGQGVYIRAQVRDASGTVVGVGNPFWFLPEGEGPTIPLVRQIVAK